MTRIVRDRYAALYGPTVGDRLRLADTDLWLEVEEDRCVGGDEAVFGGGKTIRESMLQGSRTAEQGAPDAIFSASRSCSARGLGVTVVARVPSDGPVPPPISVVMPAATAWSTICGHMKCTWQSIPRP